MAYTDDKQAAIDKAINEAESACKVAYEMTPQKYWGYITLISQTKRVGGPRDNGWFAPIRLPYMRVDGRIAMARDEHKEAGSTMAIQPARFKRPRSHINIQWESSSRK
jgi:hypothetical protein